MSTANLPLGTQHVLAPLCQQWLAKIKDAKKIKWERFGQYAVEGMKFYDAAHDWMWKDEYARGSGGFLEKDSGAALPTFRMQVNRVFEAVALFGPALYHRNPDIAVTPVRRPEVSPELLGLDMQQPQAQQLMQYVMQQEQMEEGARFTKASLMQHYVNWLQVESDKKTHARRTITEAIVKGMGVLWTDMYQPRGSRIKYPLSYHISIDDIVVDPDAEYWEDVQWIARYCCHPVNLVEQEYELPPGMLKGHMQSATAQGDVYGSRKESSQKKRHGRSFDLIEYWKVYSKNGFGDRLRKTKESVSSKFNFDAFGDFCKIVVAQNIPFPLNIPSVALAASTPEELFQRAQWETPYWEGGGWPCTFLSFYDKPRCVWPISLVKPAVAELRFVNWCMSFLADKVSGACTTYIAVAKAAGMEIQNQIKNGMAPYTVIEISQITGKSISDVVSFLDAPSFSADIWRMLSEVMEQIDKRMGLVDLIYGMTDQQLRSATEANVKEQNTNIRPDDMASRVEDFLSETAVNEIACAVWNAEGGDVEPVLGKLGAGFWDNSIKTTDFDRIIHDFDYRVGAGTARKPNKNTKQRALSEFGQVALPTIQAFAMEGIVEPWNAYMTQVCDTMDLDPAGFLLERNDEEEEEGPSPEEQMAQMELEKMKLEMQIKQQEFEVKVQASQEEARLKQQTAMAQEQVKQEAAITQMELEEEKAEQELEQDQQLHEQELQQQRELSQQELILERARLDMLNRENELKLEALKKMNEAKLAASRAQARAAAQQRSESSSEGVGNGGS